MISNERRPRGAAGFTLLEILLVFLVVSIVALTLIPAGLEAIQGTRLRTALQQTIALSEYARARALLDHRPSAILYDPLAGTVRLVQLPAREVMGADRFLETPPPRVNGSTGLYDNADGVTPIRGFTLPTGIELRDVEGAGREEETWFVVFSVSGMTDPHTVVLGDGEGHLSRIRVNGITGEVSIVR